MINKHNTGKRTSFGDRLAQDNGFKDHDAYTQDYMLKTIKEDGVEGTYNNAGKLIGLKTMILSKQ